MPEARASGGNSRCSPWRDLSSGSECGGRERLVARTAYGWAMVLKPSAAPACALRGDSSRWSVLCPTLIVIPAAASVGTVHRCAQDKLRDHRNLRSRIVEEARRPTKRPHDLARLADPHSTPLRFAQGRLFDKLRCRLQDKPADRRREISPLRDEMTKALDRPSVVCPGANVTLADVFSDRHAEPVEASLHTQMAWYPPWLRGAVGRAACQGVSAKIPRQARDDGRGLALDRLWRCGSVQLPG